MSSELTPSQIREQPWEDPFTGLLTGCYAVQSPDDPETDHLVVYIRGHDGDPDSEYRGQSTICGVDAPLWPLPRVGNTCMFCMAGVADAFRWAREALDLGL
jgi:hypothetical protein